jgi:carbohydrate diacid regulator
MERKPYEPPTAETITAVNLECLAAYAHANMNVSVASEKVFRHRNTVEYHLEQVKKKTGLDPKNFFDLAKLMEITGEMKP